MSRSFPRIVIAGTRSGVGKTSISLGLVSALKKRGLKVQTFKVGPDFLDPLHLALASKRPCYNLDGWMAGRDYVQRLFCRAAAGADITVIEGVMGLFDGADPASLTGSTAEIAQWLKSPVLLVADVHGMAGSLAAVVKGYAQFDKDVKIAGVIVNRSGSGTHAEWLAESLRASSQPPLAGAVPRGGLPVLPSRHLGLVTADPVNLSPSILDELGEACERHIDMESVLRLARKAPELHVSDLEPRPAPRRVRLGVARDQAFHFYYRDLFDELEMRGCQPADFSPLSDSRLPEECGALYIGGGYPEEYGEELSANEAMRKEILHFASSGRPIYAECGGLMYLSRELETRDRRKYPMVGLLPASTRMLERRKALGYLEVTLQGESLWGSQGAVFRGHEFHYSELTGPSGEKEGWRNLYRVTPRRSGKISGEGFQCGRILASYVHLFLPSHPEALDHFVSLCGGMA